MKKITRLTRGTRLDRIPRLTGIASLKIMIMMMKKSTTTAVVDDDEGSLFLYLRHISGLSFLPLQKNR